MGLFIYKLYNDKISMKNSIEELNDKISKIDGANIQEETTNKNEKQNTNKLETLNTDSDLVKKLYNYVAKFSYYDELIAYQSEKVTEKNMNNSLKLLTVFNNLGKNDATRVEYKYESEEIPKREHIIYAKDVVENKAKEIYEILYIDKTEKLRELWEVKDIESLFEEKINPFITNILLLLGLEYHKENIKKYNFDNEQIKIQKQRIRECLLNDIINKHYDGIRISQMLWGTYFINARLIECGRLQFEPTTNNKIKIHIPAGKNLDINEVKKAIQNSRELLKKYYNIENPKYICESWLLSKEISKMLDENSNIRKFQELFEIQSSKNGIDDVLNFVFNLKKCDNYNELPETTRIQKSIKEFLINNGTIYEGYGELKK